MGKATTKGSIMDGEQTAREATQSAERARDAFTDRVTDVRDQIKVKTDKAIGAGRELYGRAADRAQGLAENVDTMIDDQPYIAIAVAAMAGVVVGVILGMSLGGRD
jgi:ElaB/YqjD/DUF883 family membrane-anchored ribosome-binding protein